MFLEDLLKEYKYDMQVRNYSKRTIKTCYNSTLKFITYCKTEFDVEEIEELLKIYIVFAEARTFRGVHELYFKVSKGIF